MVHVHVTPSNPIILFGFVPGSCADIMHSVKHFNNGFHENVISVILRDIIKAVNYLHSLGYVHRFVGIERTTFDTSVSAMLNPFESAVRS